MKSTKSLKLINPRLTALLSASASLWLLATPGRADLLDEEVEPTVQPQPDAPTPAVPAPSKGKTPTSPAPAGDGKKPPAKGNEQTVLAPKKPTKKPAATKEREPVHFESKGLKGLREKGTVELVDEVVITQGDMRLESDHAQVFFDEAAKDVMKVVAEGNVKIFNVDPNTGEKLRVFANHGTFENRSRLITAEGNVRLWRGNDSVVRMKKATYEMDTGWIKGDRVAGELAPSEKDEKK